MKKEIITKVKDSIKRGCFLYSGDAHKDAATKKLKKSDVRSIMLKGFHIDIKEIYSEEEIKEKVQDKKFLNASRYICYYNPLFKKDVIICYTYDEKYRVTWIIHIGDVTNPDREKIRDLIKKFKKSKVLFLQIMRSFLL